MRQFGLIGKTLKHSFSKKYFTTKFEKEGITDCQYNLYELPKIEDLAQLLNETKNLKGLNVTIPYKQAVIPFLNELSPEAQKIAAVNTIAFTSKGIVGHNTDVYGFKNSLMPLLKSHHKKALILGTGGASKAVAFVLEQLNIDFQLVSRNPNKGLTYNLLNKTIVEEYPLIINTTPLGTSPNIEYCPNIPYQYLTQHNLLFDLVYNPTVTLFMQKGLAQKASVKNGHEMLVLQAEKAWEIWNADM